MRNILLCSILFMLFSMISDVKAEKIIDARSGVEIIFTAEDGMFPYTWYSGDIKGKAVSLDSSEIIRSTEIVKKALSKYPVDVIKKNLDKIYVMKSLEFYGVIYGGTNTKNIVYIANNGIEPAIQMILLNVFFTKNFLQFCLPIIPMLLTK